MDGAILIGANEFGDLYDRHLNAKPPEACDLMKYEASGDAARVSFQAKYGNWFGISF